jgi:type I restriction enzyme S subunit
MVKMMQNVSVNVGVPNLNLGNTRNLPVPTPPLPTQEKIADILSAFDDKIELNNKISRTLEQMAQAIFKEWFVKSEKLKVKSEKLSNLIKTQYGYTESASEKAIGPKFLRVTDINKTNWIDWGAVPYCKIGNAELPKYKLRRGDVVIARMADPGKVAIVEEDASAIFASYLIRLQIISDAITPYFLFYYLRSRSYQDFIFGASTGTTRQSANARVITDVELTVPPKAKVLEFENIASVIREKNRSNVKENQKLAALRDLLLPKLMSGEIKV